MIDDALPELYRAHIEEELGSDSLDWEFQEEASHSGAGFARSFSGFSHLAYLAQVDAEPPVMAPLTPLLLPALYMFCDKAGLGFTNLLRIRIGLFRRNAAEAPHHNPHVDFVQPHHTAVYYVNDSDGDTTIFRETVPQVAMADAAALANRNGFHVERRVPPRRGRVVVFNGARYHASMHPRTADKRLAITFNFV